jgi:hypothetical protein
VSHAQTIVWRRLDKPGHEICNLEEFESGRKLTGIAILSHDQTPCSLEYAIDCDSEWRTNACRVSGRMGNANVALYLRREGAMWKVNGVEVPSVARAEDVDLGFSPSTNLLPIRRLSLKVGERATVRASWVRFPELTVELLEQTYTRVADDRYRYESAGGQFQRELKVNDVGFVIDYPDLWIAESQA